MIPKNSILRIARPTDHLRQLSNMYKDGLGFKELGSFIGHSDFDGILLGHDHLPYHLEFTQHRGSIVGFSSTEDHLLVFYITDQSEWEKACEKMISAGFKHVRSFNPYWDNQGKSFEDIDKYRVVLQNAPSPV